LSPGFINFQTVEKHCFVESYFWYFKSLPCHTVVVRERMNDGNALSCNHVNWVVDIYDPLGVSLGKRSRKEQPLTTEIELNLYYGMRA